MNFRNLQVAQNFYTYFINRELFTKTKILRKVEMSTVLRIFTLLLLCAPALSFALGLGNVAINSNLGEPLQATVTITDAESSPDLSCFSVIETSDTPAFKKTNISLKSIAGNYQLNISTPNVISAAVINLRISINCKPNLTREYLFLLDPAPLPSSSTIAINKQTAYQDIANTDHSAVKTNIQAIQLQPLETSQPATSSSLKILKKNSVGKKIKAETSAEKRLLEAYTGKQADGALTQPAKHNQSATEGTDSVNKTHLVISGVKTNVAKDAKNPSLSLRLETEIDLSKAKQAVPLNKADALDEVTVMTNRLNHLKKNIVGLQDKNTLLQLEAEKAKNSSLLSNQATNFLSNLSVALAIVAVLAGAIWLRRKMLSRRRQLNEDANWFSSDESLENEPLTKNSTASADTATFDAINLNQSASNQELSGQNHNNSFHYPNTYTVNDNDVSESVLDHAEVFIAHDRPAMAIQLLQNHLMDAPVESPEIWLKLISLLATEGTETEYDNAVVACKQFFNIKLPSFADASSIDASTIEDYPHILARLQDVWGSEFAVEFLNDLIFNRQSQPREGFGRSTFEELFFLDQIANSLHASNKFKKRSTSSEAANNLPPMEIESVEQMLQDYGISSADLETQHEKKTLFAAQKASHQQNDAFNADSFSNVQDSLSEPVKDNFDISFTTESSTENQLSDINNDHAVKTPAFDLDMLYHTENTAEPSEITAPLNTDTAIHKSFDEMDFSGAVDEINIEAPDDITDTDTSKPKAVLAAENFSDENLDEDKLGDKSLPEDNFTAASFPEIEFSVEHHTLADHELATEYTLEDHGLDFTLDLPESPTEKNTKQASNIETLSLPDMIEWEQPKSTSSQSASNREIKSKPKS